MIVQFHKIGKISLEVIVLKNTLLVVLFVLFSFNINLFAQQSNRKASLKSIIGEVKIRRGNSPKWVPARPNMPLKPKDAVRTFVESEALIKTSEGTVIKLGENATFEIQKLSGTIGGQSKTSVKILTGSLGANVKKLVGSSSSFEFETPTAVAAIRGTKLGIDVKDSKTSVKVYEGKVYVKPVGADKGAEVKADQMTTVAKGQKDIKIEKMAEEDKSSDIMASLDTIATEDTVTVDTSVTDTGIVDTTVTDTTATDTLSATDTTTTDTSSTDTVVKVELTLSVATPKPGELFAPGAPVPVSGKVTSGDVKVFINGKETKPAPNGLFKMEIKVAMEAGDHDITIEASFGGKSENVVRSYSVKAPEGALFLNIDEPQPGQEITEPLVKVRGRTAPGAEVSIAGTAVPVSPDGSFRGEVPIPDEEGEVSVDVEATLGSQSIPKVIKVIYKAPQEDIDLVVTKPAQGFISCDGNIQISARVRPAKASVSVNGQALNNSNGEISGFFKVNEDPGDVTLDFEVDAEKESKNYNVGIVFDPVGKQCNTDIPEVQPSTLPASVNQSSLSFTVFDRTQGDQVSFKYTVDGGSLSSESGANGSRFSMPLDEGKHAYSIWAEDLAGNKSNVVSGNVIVMTKAPLITLDEPSSHYTLLHIPPPAPNRPDFHLYDLSFTVDNLPDDDGDLLSEVIVQVEGGSTKTKNKFYGRNDFDFSIKLKRGRNNINIVVRDKNNRQVEKPLVIEIR